MSRFGNKTVINGNIKYSCEQRTCQSCLKTCRLITAKNALDCLLKCTGNHSVACQDGCNFYVGITNQALQAIPVPPSAPDSTLITRTPVEFTTTKAQPAKQAKRKRKKRRSQSTNNGDCRISGITLKDGTKTSLNFGGFPDCVSCHCFNGFPLCIGNWKSIYKEQIADRSCSSVSPCSAFIKKAPNACRHPLNADCQTGNFNWTQDGCSYACKNNNFSFQVIEKPWCHKLVSTDFCASCGNKTEIFAKHGDMFAECSHSKEIIWKIQICDGFVDCSDGTDEQYCSQSFCPLQRTNIIKEIYWPRTPVNTTLTIDCSVIFSFWKGFINRTCLQKPGKRSFLTEADFCSCQDPRVFRFNSFDFSGLDYSAQLSNASLKLKMYAIKAVRASQYMHIADEIMTMAKAKNYTKDSHEMRPFFERMYDVLHRIPPCSEDGNSTLGNVSKWKHMFPDHIRTVAQSTNGHASTFLASYKHDLMQLKLGLLTKIPSNSIVAESNAESVAESMQKLPTLMEIRVEANFRNSTLKSNQSWTENLGREYNITADKNFTKTENGKFVNSIRVRKRVAKIEQKLSHIKNSLLIETVLGSISVLSCIACLILYKVLRVENKTKVFLHKNLFLSWLVSYAWQIIGRVFETEMQPYKDFCTAYLVTYHYWILTVFTWMSLEGVNLLIVLVVVFQTRKRRHFFYSLVGWGLPLFIIFAETAIFLQDFKKNKSCLGLESKEWLFKGPIAFLLTINCVILLLILVFLLKNIFRSAKYSTGFKRSRATGKAFIVLLPLLGVTYILGFFMQHTAIAYLYVILNSFVGLLLAIFHFILDPTVQFAYGIYRRRTKAAQAAKISNVNRQTGTTANISNVYDNTAL